jgi:AmiR/NasT family two-component response regulator
MASRRLPAGTVPYPVGVRARVVLAEDNALLRHGLVRLIEAAPDLEFVGSAADLPGLKALIETQSPDVVVTDIRMPPRKLTRASRSPPFCAPSTPRWACCC